MNTKELREHIRRPYAWPGGYPFYAITSDGACLCMRCCRTEYRQISYAVRHALNDGWRVEAFDINWEDTNLLCDHCNEPIESAYEETGHAT
jgi:hypothetical protein